MGLSVKKLSVRDFRNYQAFTLALHENLTVIHGPNAVGKTNLIEALQLLTAGDSFRRPAWNDVIREGANESRISLTAEGDRRLLEVDLTLKKDKRRQYTVNGAPKKSISGSNGSLPSVLFTPEDLGLVKGSSEQRRAAVDSLGEQLSVNYGSLRRQYQRILRQRNSLLKEEGSPAELEIWTSQLVQIGSRLMKHRSQLVEKLARRLETIHLETTGSPGLHVRYLPSWNRDTNDTSASTPEQWKHQFEEALLQAHSAEARRKTSLFGPHRDEIDVVFEGKQARVFSSQGQQRSIALAWKLAEVDVVEEVLKIQPLLLLDDVMSELDETRRALLTARVQRATQTVITTTNLPYFDSSLLASGAVISLD